MASTSITQTTTPPKYYDFYDEAIIYVRGGSGGQGATTFQAKGGKPNGGHGGKGGDILLQLDSSVNTLSHLNNPTNSWIRSFRAPNGADGKVAFKNGKWADNVIIPVPSGTIVQELPLEEKKDDEEEDETTTTYIKKRQQLQSKKHTIELSYATNVTTIRLAKGGEGGDGNAGSATHPGSSTTRRVSPQGGERKRIQLILKIVGDVAIVSECAISLFCPCFKFRNLLLTKLLCMDYIYHDYEIRIIADKRKIFSAVFNLSVGSGEISFFHSLCAYPSLFCIFFSGFPERRTPLFGIFLFPDFTAAVPK
jgi:hypothetical protein